MLLCPRERLMRSDKIHAIVLEIVKARCWKTHYEVFHELKVHGLLREGSLFCLGPPCKACSDLVFSAVEEEWQKSGDKIIALVEVKKKFGGYY